MKTEESCKTCKDFYMPTGFCDYWGVLIVKSAKKIGCKMHTKNNNKKFLGKERK
jgi:hypothetical protein